MHVVYLNDLNGSILKVELQKLGIVHFQGELIAIRERVVLRWAWAYADEEVP